MNPKVRFEYDNFTKTIRSNLIVAHSHFYAVLSIKKRVTSSNPFCLVKNKRSALKNQEEESKDGNVHQCTRWLSNKEIQKAHDGNVVIEGWKME
jgi:hypothetical protein